MNSAALPRTAATLLGLAFLLALLAPARAQAPPTPPPGLSASATAATATTATTETPLLTTRTSLVLVPTLVTDRKGSVVYTLTAQDFTITDDGIEQKLTLDEETGGEPLALVVAFETGAAGARHLDQFQGLEDMIEALAGAVPHTVAVVEFDSAPRIVQEFTPRPSVVQGALDDLSEGDNRAAILDSLAFSVDMLRKAPRGYRRAILLVSETLDHGSRIKLDEAVRLVSDTNTTIYSLAFSTTGAELKDEAAKFSSDEPGPPGGCMSRDPDADKATQQSRGAQAYDCLSLLAPPLRLAKMAAIATRNALRKNVPETVAHMTGGEYYKFSSAKSIERDLLTIANHMPNRYVLSFHPAAPHPGLHALEVSLKDYPNLKVAARNRYWVEENP